MYVRASSVVHAARLSVRTLKDGGAVVRWTQATALKCLVEVTGERGGAGGGGDGDAASRCFETLYEAYVDVVEAASGRGASAAQLQGFVPRAEALLLAAYRRLPGQEESSATLDAALEHGHELYPEKQGRAKVSKAASRLARRASAGAGALASPRPLKRPLAAAAAAAAAAGTEDEDGQAKEGQPAAAAASAVAPPAPAVVEVVDSDDDRSGRGGGSNSKRRRIELAGAEEEEDEDSDIIVVDGDGGGDDEHHIRVDDLAVDG